MMKTTQYKMDALIAATDEYEVARDAVADALSDLAADLDTDISTRLAEAEPDGATPENLRCLHDEIETSGLVESDEDEDE